MPGGARRLWSPARRWAGNLLPLIGVAPGLAWAAWAAWTAPFSPFFWWSIAAAALAGWLAVGLLGTLPKRTLKARLDAMIPREDGEQKRVMAGISRPGGSGALDPHQHLGFVIFTDRVLVLAAENLRMEIRRSELMEARLAPNAHTWLGLGGWIAVSGRAQGKAFEVRVEPAGAWTLWGCAAARRPLLRLIRAWLALSS
jgi:hypothetical protein